MADEATATVETTDAPSIDIDSAVEQISHDLFPETLNKEEKASPTEAVAKAVTEQKEAIPTKEIPPLSTVRPAPKSWAKDIHPVWEKIDPKAQEYIEKREKDFLDGLEQYKQSAHYGKAIADVLQPYHPILQAKGLDAPRAVADLMQTYVALTQGTPEQRQAALMQVATNLKIPLPAASTETPQTPLDPRIQTLEQRLAAMEQERQWVAQQEAQTLKERAMSEVNTFASAVDKDGKPLHPYFDECHEDITKLIIAGYPLQEAYEKAVWANPVTREKEKLSYFQTESEKAKERARLDALPKQKARSVNVKSQDAQRTPTEPLGSMEDTLRSTFRQIKERTIH